MDSATTDSTPHKLRERIKELTALHRTARLLQDDVRSVEDVLRDVVALLPEAWQFPEVAAARIQFGSLSLSSPGFRPTAWMQSAVFESRADQTGVLEIAYLEERGQEVEGPFLSEERELIDSLAEMLCSYLKRKLADEELRLAQHDLEQLVEERTRDLRRLAAELSLAEARKNRDIATHLHDNVVQEFAFMRLQIQKFRGDAVFCGFEQRFDEIIALLDRAIQFTRKLTFEISTPILYELGLPEALEWLCEQFETRHDMRIRAIVPKRGVELSEDQRIILFRCTQELLTNAVKYSHATLISVSLEITDESVSVQVKDNGVGFDLRTVAPGAKIPEGFGLFSIRERMRYVGGQLLLQSGKDFGTTATLLMPRAAL
ncbi:MAG: ATP-binding protein [Calditrichaeota bacterium]|nr:ATP-binding protein [Calditrichota bacterium]